MTSIYDNYGERQRGELKTNFDPTYILRDIEYGERDIKDIQAFIIAAREQLAIIEKTTFKRFIEVRKGKDHYAGKVEFSISVYRVPQVPGNELLNGIPRLRVYEHDDSQRFVGNDKRKEFIEYVQARRIKYPDAELIGNAIGLIKPVKAVVQL